MNQPEQLRSAEEWADEFCKGQSAAHRAVYISFFEKIKRNARQAALIEAADKVKELEYMFEHDMHCQIVINDILALRDKPSVPTTPAYE